MNKNDNGSEQENPWPVPKFHFRVTFGNVGTMDFQEVSGLDSEYYVVEYRAGSSAPWSTVKQPGLMKSSDVTFKKGMCKTDSTIADYFFNSVSMNVVERQEVTIQLLDEEAKPLFTWTLANAFPMKITFPDFNAEDFNAEASEIALEEITLTHEGIKTEAGS